MCHAPYILIFGANQVRRSRARKYCEKKVNQGGQSSFHVRYRGPTYISRDRSSFQTWTYLCMWVWPSCELWDASSIRTGNFSSTTFIFHIGTNMIVPSHGSRNRYPSVSLRRRSFRRVVLFWLSLLASSVGGNSNSGQNQTSVQPTAEASKRTQS